MFVFVRPLVTQSIEFAEDYRRTSIVCNGLQSFGRHWTASTWRIGWSKSPMIYRIDCSAFRTPLLDLQDDRRDDHRSREHRRDDRISLAVRPSVRRYGLAMIPDGRLRRRVDSLGVKSLGAVSGWVLGNVLTSVVAGVAALVLSLRSDCPMRRPRAVGGDRGPHPARGGDARCDPRDRLGFLVSRSSGSSSPSSSSSTSSSRITCCSLPCMDDHQAESVPRLARHLVGIELAGFVGALLALPVAGIIQIIVLDVLETNGHPVAPGTGSLPPRTPSSGP